MTRQMPSQVSTRTDPPAPLKVLHVFYELRYSGGEVMMRVASGLWAQKGIECTIAAVADVVGPYADTLESAGYRVHRLPPSAPRMFTSYSRLLRSLKPHVVHLHVERANFWLALEALGFGTRVVQTVHNCFPFTGALRIERTIQRRLLRRFGVNYVAVAPSVSLHEWRAFHNRTEIIWNWCDLEMFKETTDTDREAARRLLGLQWRRPSSRERWQLLTCQESPVDHAGDGHVVDTIEPRLPPRWRRHWRGGRRRTQTRS